MNLEYQMDTPDENKLSQMDVLNTKNINSIQQESIGSNNDILSQNEINDRYIRGFKRNQLRTRKKRRYPKNKYLRYISEHKLQVSALSIEVFLLALLVNVTLDLIYPAGVSLNVTRKGPDEYKRIVLDLDYFELGPPHFMMNFGEAQELLPEARSPISGGKYKNLTLNYYTECNVVNISDFQSIPHIGGKTPISWLFLGENEIISESKTESGNSTEEFYNFFTSHIGSMPNMEQVLIINQMWHHYVYSPFSNYKVEELYFDRALITTTDGVVLFTITFYYLLRF